MEQISGRNESHDSFEVEQNRRDNIQRTRHRQEFDSKSNTDSS